AVCFIKKPIMRILPQPIFFVLILIFFSSCGDSSKQSESNEEETQKNAQIKQPVNVTGEEVSYSTDSVDMKGYISYNSEIEGKRPGILVIHEWWGHTDYVRKRADMLAELGYVGFALDMYGDGKSADHPEDAKKYSGMVMQNMDGAKARFDEAYQLLASHPTVDRDKLSAIGYCFGGAVALAMANAGKPLDGIAIFHSSVQVAIPPTDKLQARILVQNGADDPMISPESVEAFKNQMDSLNADYEYISYAGAQHGYTNPGATELGQKFDMPISYNLEADTTSWNELKTFLNELYPSGE